MRPIKRSFTISGHRTSLTLEAPFWEVLEEAARRDGVSLSALIARIDRQRGPKGEGGLSGATRVFVLDYALKSRPSAAFDDEE